VNAEDDLKIFMQALRPHQTKCRGVGSANTYWLKHVFADHFGHYMTEEYFVESVLALEEGWIIKKTKRPVRFNNSMHKPWLLNVTRKSVLALQEFSNGR